jgi:hypothetical protein
MLLVKHTYYGDTDFNGKVDFDGDVYGWQRPRDGSRRSESVSSASAGIGNCSAEIAR